MKRAGLVLNLLLFVQNISVLVGLFALLWLHSRSFRITDPLILQLIGKTNRLMAGCLLSGLVLGLVILYGLRLIERRMQADLPQQKTWAYVSLILTLIVLFSAMVPTRHG